jgi:tetratricopeptide (TPR) repeat protein
MQAVISGRAGIAVMRDNDRWFALRAQVPEQPIPCLPSFRNRLLTAGRDLVFLDQTDLIGAGRCLKYEYALANALDNFLFLLDADLPTSVREDAALELLSLFHETEKKLANIFFARPLPAGTDVETALKICKKNDAAVIVNFLEGLLEVQPFIREVNEAWKAIPESAFVDANAREQAQALFVREGLFRNLVETARNKQWIGLFQINALAINEIHTFPNHRIILQDWVHPFKRLQQADKATDFQESSALLNCEEGRAQNTRQRYQPTHNIKLAVDKQKNAIIEAMAAHRFDRAKDYVEDLILFQLANGAPEFLCKSLCDLAIKAQELYQHQFQYWLTSKAVLIKNDDGWSWAQHGKALLELNRPHEALEACEEAILWMNDVVAKNGRAEVLKALNRLPDALAAYDAIISEHPESVAAKNGRAEVLKALNHLPDALAAYDAIISEYPEDIFAKSGRAEVLKALNRLPDALAAYDAIISEHPESVVAKNGRAEVLKALNRLPDALAAYDAIISEHPEDVVAKNGRAEVLKALNRLPDALAAYDAIISEDPEDIFAKSGRAEVLKALNRLSDALAAYDAIISEHPESVVAKSGRAELLKALNHLPDALAAYDAIISEHPEDVVAKNGRASILVMMGEYDKALSALQIVKPVTENEWISYHIRGMILLRQNKLAAAITIFEYGADNNPRPADRDYFRASLAVVLIRQRKLDKVAKILESISKPALLIPAMLLKVHAFGEGGNIRRLFEVGSLIPAFVYPLFQPLRDEIGRRYIQQQPARYDDEWLFQREAEMVLAV